jgi:potassium channel LctB
MIKRKLADVKTGVEKHVERFTGFGKILFDKPILKFFVFLAIQIIISFISEFFPGNIILRAVINVISVLISIYFIVILIYLIRKWFKKLLNPENIFMLIVSYILFILGILLFLSTIFDLAEIAGFGYLKYGVCSDNFNSSMIKTDAQASKGFFYFTAITFFSVGYGDICPMGIDRTLAVITAFIGHLISVIIVVLIINNYIRKKEEG